MIYSETIYSAAIYSAAIYSEATAKRSKTLELEVDKRLHIGSDELIYAHNRYHYNQ